MSKIRLPNPADPRFAARSDLASPIEVVVPAEDFILKVNYANYLVAQYQKNPPQEWFEVGAPITLVIGRDSVVIPATVNEGDVSVDGLPAHLDVRMPIQARVEDPEAEDGRFYTVTVPANVLIDLLHVKPGDFDSSVFEGEILLRVVPNVTQARNGVAEQLEIVPSGYGEPRRIPIISSGRKALSERDLQPVNVHGAGVPFDAEALFHASMVAAEEEGIYFSPGDAKNRGFLIAGANDALLYAAHDRSHKAELDPDQEIPEGELTVLQRDIVLHPAIAHAAALFQMHWAKQMKDKASSINAELQTQRLVAGYAAAIDLDPEDPMPELLSAIGELRIREAENAKAPEESRKSRDRRDKAAAFSDALTVGMDAESVSEISEASLDWVRVYAPDKFVDLVNLEDWFKGSLDGDEVKARIAACWHLTPGSRRKEMAAALEEVVGKAMIRAEVSRSVGFLPPDHEIKTADIASASYTLLGVKRFREFVERQLECAGKSPEAGRWGAMSHEYLKEMSNEDDLIPNDPLPLVESPDMAHLQLDQLPGNPAGSLIKRMQRKVEGVIAADESGRTHVNFSGMYASCRAIQPDPAQFRVRDVGTGQMIPLDVEAFRTLTTKTRLNAQTREWADSVWSLRLRAEDAARIAARVDGLANRRSENPYILFSGRWTPNPEEVQGREPFSPSGGLDHIPVTAHHLTDTGDPIPGLAQADEDGANGVLRVFGSNGVDRRQFSVPVSIDRAGYDPIFFALSRNDLYDMVAWPAAKSKSEITLSMKANGYLVISHNAERITLVPPARLDMIPREDLPLIDAQMSDVPEQLRAVAVDQADIQRMLTTLHRLPDPEEPEAEGLTVADLEAAVEVGEVPLEDLGIGEADSLPGEQRSFQIDQLIEQLSDNHPVEVLDPEEEEELQVRIAAQGIVRNLHSSSQEPKPSDEPSSEMEVRSLATSGAGKRGKGKESKIEMAGQLSMFDVFGSDSETPDEDGPKPRVN